MKNQTPPTYRLYNGWSYATAQLKSFKYIFCSVSALLFYLSSRSDCYSYTPTLENRLALLLKALLFYDIFSSHHFFDSSIAFFILFRVFLVLTKLRVLPTQKVTYILSLIMLHTYALVTVTSRFKHDMSMLSTISKHWKAINEYQCLVSYASLPRLRLVFADSIVVYPIFSLYAGNTDILLFSLLLKTNQHLLQDQTHYFQRASVQMIRPIRHYYKFFISSLSRNWKRFYRTVSVLYYL